MMLLVFDVGNTHTVFGLYQGQALQWSWRLESDRNRTVDEYALQIVSLMEHEGVTLSGVSRVAISCVVPKLTRVFSKISEKYFRIQPLLVSAAMLPDMIVDVDAPERVGSDRLVNALAAREHYGSPVIVVDFGTATTFDVVGPRGDYQGGVIAPGLLISAEALFERAALLPNIELIRPRAVIGKNTEEAMRSGIFLGYVALVDGIVERLFAELGEKAQVIATGGLSRAIADESKYIQEVVSDLTLEGLRLIVEKGR